MPCPMLDSSSALTSSLKESARARTAAFAAQYDEPPNAPACAMIKVALLHLSDGRALVVVGWG